VSIGSGTGDDAGSVSNDSFVYDGVSRLKEAQVRNHAQTYVYDAFGNLVATLGGPTMFARIGVMLALNRDHRPTSEPRRKAVKKYEGQFSDCQSFKVVIEPWHASSTQNGAGVRF